MDKILLIDTMNQIWRANIGFGPLQPHQLCGLDKASCKTSKHQLNDVHCKCGSPWNHANSFCYGEQYNVVYNFFRNMRPLIEQFKPNKCFFVLEGHAKFRYELFPEYKSDRKLVKEASSNLDNFYFQKDIIVNLLKCLPVTIVRAADYEADDVIYTLCENLKDEDVTILSNDSDFIQLLQKGYSNLKIYSPITKEFMKAPENVNYVLLKSIIGDTSDSIPGFKGYGPKRAEKLLLDPKKFEEFVSLEENRANLSIYKQLIEFHFVPDEELQLIDGEVNWNKIRLEFLKMKFNSILNDKTWEKFTSTFDSIKF